MRKKLLGVLLSMAMAITACASDYLAIEITDNGGQKTVLLLEDKPTAKYIDGELVITSSETTLSFPQNETVEVVFKEQGEVGVDEIKTANAVGMIVSPESVEIINLIPASSVFLFSLSGSLVSETQADNEGTARMPLTEAGVYVIKTNTKIFKILKK